MYLEKVKVFNRKNNIEIFLDVAADESIIDDVLFKFNSFLTTLSKHNNMFAEIAVCDFKTIESNFKIISKKNDFKRIASYYIKDLSLNQGLFSCMFGDFYIYSNETTWNDFLMKKNKIRDSSLVARFSFNDIGNFVFNIAKTQKIETDVKKFLVELENLGFLIDEKHSIIETLLIKLFPNLRK